MKGICESTAECGARASEAGRRGLASGSGAPLPSSFQAQELSPCLHFGEAPRMRLLPTPSPGFLFSPRSEPEASKLLVSAALLLCDCSEEKRTSVRRGCLRPVAAHGGRSRVNASLIPEISGALVNESYIFKNCGDFFFVVTETSPNFDFINYISQERFVCF